jgi:hypothetical protein
MSYFPQQPVQPTPGLAFEAFQAGTHNPAIPQAMYSPAAAGPRFLDGLGAHTYMSQLRSHVPPGLRGCGMGDAVSDLQGLLQGGAQGLIQYVVNQSWPTVQANIDKSMLPIKIMGGVTAVGAIAAAVFSYLAWQKRA